jgi:hypothetical protein
MLNDDEGLRTLYAHARFDAALATLRTEIQAAQTADRGYPLLSPEPAAAAAGPCAALQLLCVALYTVHVAVERGTDAPTDAQTDATTTVSSSHVALLFRPCGLRIDSSPVVVVWLRSLPRPIALRTSCLHTRPSLFQIARAAGRSLGIKAVHKLLWNA